MSEKPTYDELKMRIKELERQSVESKRVEKVLQYRLQLDKLITSISSKFINLPTHEIDNGIYEALKAIGEFTNMQRSYIFRFNDDSKTMDNTHEWCAKGVEPQIQRLKKVPLTLSSWLINQIKSAKAVHVPRVDQLPPEAESLRRENEFQGVKSLILVPTEYTGTVIGFLGLDSVKEQRSWPPDAVVLLRMMGEIFANAIERKRAEEALLQSEEKYRTIIEAIEEGFWEVDLAGSFTFANPSICRFLEYSYSELMGMNYREYVDSEVAERIYKVFNAIYKTGKSGRLEDYEMIAKTGKRKVFELSASLMRDSSGQPIGFRGVSRDVTERKFAERALIESEERYRTAMEANPDPVAVFDLEGRVIYFNPAFEEVFGWILDEQQGKKIKDFIPEENLAESKEMEKRVLAGEVFFGIETQRYTKKGELIPVSISGAVYKDVNGDPMGSVITIRDIREKKRVEEHILNAHKLESLGTLAGGIAHDFNNLLMAIQGNVSLALFDMDPGNPHYQLLKNIKKSVKSGSRLTSQLLGYARGGKYKVKIFDLNQLIKGVSEAFGRTMRKVAIDYDLAKDLHSIEADEGQIEQVLLNILVNAGQAMPDGGELFLKTKNVRHEDMKSKLYNLKSGTYVQLIVADTGTGIDKNTMAHIFEPFFTTKDVGLGTGLGLASAYGIITGHGGYIDVDSELGRGTTFKIYLPAVEKMPSAVLTDTEEFTFPGMETVLLVDDDNMVLETGIKMLERLGYSVLAAKDGVEAVNIYKEKSDIVDLVILDLIMPKMGGGEVFDRIKLINSKARIIISSGYSVNGQAKEILKRGCDGFIQKPFSINALSSKIREILEI
ncbi:PAS domain S-box protein [Thermodesulfobacteriota bacterium]